MFQVPMKTQYAIRALVHLARTDSDCASRIAETEHISVKYLEGILNQLKLSGFIVSDRGRAGGYHLARPAQSIHMSEVMQATEGDVRLVECIDDKHVCSMGSTCMPRNFWLGLKNAVDSYLSSVTLAELAKEPLPASASSIVIQASDVEKTSGAEPAAIRRIT
ncbi:MAG: Rrf2 family transcriptional regulator [Spirochaetaceae bacterium]|nr:Rrf2 family transcriptional regulator [Spirochaetaceae bacterium]